MSLAMTPEERAVVVNRLTGARLQPAGNSFPIFGKSFPWTGRRDTDTPEFEDFGVSRFLPMHQMTSNYKAIDSATPKLNRTDPVARSRDTME